MLRHTFKLIWNQRKSNTWIFFETVLVFTILWFCCDYLYYMGSRATEPKGFDTEHVYQVKLRFKTQDEITVPREERMSEFDRFQTMKTRLKLHPAVEAVGLSRLSAPYDGSSALSDGFVVNGDSLRSSIRLGYFDRGFLDVFKLKLLQGDLTGWDESTTGNEVLINGDAQGMFENIPVEQVNSLTNRDRDNPVRYQLKGVIERTKDRDYNPYVAHLYRPFSRTGGFGQPDLSIRIKPEYDKKDFAEKFVNEMREQLDLDATSLGGLIPYKDKRDTAMRREDGQVSGILSVTGFLVVNIFLGMIGTFWFRSQTRRSEIGLRMAIGSSRKKIQSLMVLETLVIVFLATLVGMVLAANLNKGDLLSSIGMPMEHWQADKFPIQRYLINYLLTFGFLAIISVAAVWYPARQAAKTQPAETLHEE